MDLSKKRENGGTVDGRKISKHQKDVLRLFPLLTGETRVQLLLAIRDDMRAFLEGLRDEKVDLSNYGIRSMTLPQVIQNLMIIYGL